MYSFYIKSEVSKCSCKSYKILSNKEMCHFLIIFQRKKKQKKHIILKTRLNNNVQEIKLNMLYNLQSF